MRFHSPMLPPSRPPAPSGSATRLWQPSAAMLVPPVAVGLFLLCLWVLGTRYELRPPSEFQPENVVQPVIDDSVAVRLRRTAGELDDSGDRLEQRALQDTITDATAKALLARAQLQRARARTLEAKASERDVILARRHSKRLLWLYAAAVDLVVCILAGLIALGATYGALRKGPVRWREPRLVVPAMLALSFFAAVLFSWVWYDYATPPYALVEATVGRDIRWFVQANDGMHVLAVALIMCGGAFTAPPVLARRGAVEAVSGEAEAIRTAREIAQRNGLFRLALYVAAAMLVTYVAAVSSLFQWVLAFVNADPAVASSVEALANSAVTARALLASGLLVFGFGAATAMVRVVGLDLARVALPNGSAAEWEAWTEQQELVSTDLRQRFKTLAAILAPLATGVLAQILQSVA